MPTPADRLQAALREARDFPSFSRNLLRDALGWPVPQEAARPFEVGYEWSPDEVGFDRTTHKARAWELMLLARERQPHGVFLLEFHDARVFETRGFATPLRAVLRRLVAGQRKSAHLPSWSLDNILFICTHDYTEYVFAMFRDTFKTGKVAEARLATFGWKAGEPCRTVGEHNLPHLRWPEDEDNREAWVKAWAEAFNKEPLTDRFFKHFDAALAQVKADLMKHNRLDPAQAYSKAQLLLERLIFLYFVQNRGWLDQNPNFLRAGFEPFRSRPAEFSYYEQFLEPLFWSLSSAGHTSFDRNEAVPFLNGGLFNDDEFEPSPKRRKDNPPLRIRNATFAQVFDDFLDAYNFTVREDTPLNQEVAVDPEMLGKVFESIVLQAESADPDAVAPDKRKATGSYYTPRIVVHFICREVLFQHLKLRLDSADWPQRLRQLLGLDSSDGLDPEEMAALKQCLTPDEGARLLELVKPLRCCDPAVGSGAFMVGLLHELTNLRRLAQTAANGYVDPLREHGSRWLQETKADIIENCLFGVDIQQQAIEICMLRLWLSLVVDYDLGLDPFQAGPAQFRARLKQINQLPNLEMNFKRGDSLHDHICGVSVVILPGREARLQKHFDAIQRLGEKLHKAKSADYKWKLRLEILEKRLEVSEAKITEELRQLRTKDSQTINMFGESKSEAEQRRRIAHEIGQLEKALAGIRAAQVEREKLVALKVNHDMSRLRKLEGASFDAPFNFAWRIDFPQVFASIPSSLKGEGKGEGAGFDIIVGNPPFVTARNPVKRELYRERWQPYCYKAWHMLVPFFVLSAKLLKARGQLGFIVSNAFGKRAFGKPFVEQFFPTVNLQKVVDCSGFHFEGHGTPTCLVFLSTTRPHDADLVRVAALKPGGGALKLLPEDSSLWHAIAQHHDEDYADERIIIAAHPRSELHAFPWSFLQDADSGDIADTLAGFVSESIGHQCITRTDEVFIVPRHFIRAARIERAYVRPLGTGESLRNWAHLEHDIVIFPYDSETLKAVRPTDAPRCISYMKPFRSPLENVVMHGSVRKKETTTQWFEYSRLARAKFAVPLTLAIPEIATHIHTVLSGQGIVFHQTAQAVKLSAKHGLKENLVLAGLVNSSYALFWLKQVCFNKGAGEDEERDRYVFAGGKVEQLPVPEKVASALRGEWNPLAKRLAELAEACWQRGQKLPSLALKKLFEKQGEAYHDWNSSLPGYEKPHPAIGKPFGTAEELKLAYERVVAEREKLRAEMIALQEEMDWLVYAAYGLLPEDHPAVSSQPLTADRRPPEPLKKDDRPYRLWQAAKGDLSAAIGLIPTDRSNRSDKLWRARLAAIRDSEHIRRIEQPVYKRRWDEQWKVKGRWECGPVAYDAELADAFTWWLLEKAEWYLEHKTPTHTVFLSEWAEMLRRDKRVLAAVEAVAPTSNSIAAFTSLLKTVVDDETVPAAIPFAKPWDELAKDHAKSELSKTRKIRGKLNVPRERFHLVSKGIYKWAGLLFK